MLGERALKNRAVGRPNGGPHPVRDLLIGQAAQRMDLIRHDPNRHFAGDFPGGVSTHAVGHDKDPPVGDHAEAVFISRPDNADVGAARGSDVHVISR